MQSQPDYKVFRPERMPNKSLLSRMGIEPPPGRGLSEWVKQGIPYEAFDRLHTELGLSQERLARLSGIPVTTLRRRAAEGRFNSREGDRLLRIATVFERTVELFEGDREQARQWLMSPARGLGGVTPLEHLETEAGAREVLDLIGRLEHGVFS
jgi:putative toxin-antitoxin system antitoxin component (TIGR02293 family)